MKQIDDLISLVSNSSINDNEWADDMILRAMKMAETIYSSGNMTALFDAVGRLQGVGRFRLVQVILDFEDDMVFDFLIKNTPEFDFDTAEIIIDSLRTWDLTRERSLILIQVYNSLKGQCKLLDYVMEDYIRKNK